MKINLYKIDLPTIDKLIEELTKKNYNLLESKNTKDSTFYLFLNSKIRKTKNWIEELSHVFDELNKNEFDFGNI
ncbi:MAG TPA: hypothetical protein DER56_06810 [Thermosipho africanus]|nr:hypothetical protein [Thermosipho africanus]